MAYGYARSRSSELDHRDAYEGGRRSGRYDRDERPAREAYDEPRGRSRRRRGPRDSEVESHEDEGQFGFRYEEADDRYRADRGRRPERRAHRDEVVTEERVTRILDDAFDAMQHTLRLNEDRTAEAIDNLARRLEDRRHDNRVREMQSGLERNFNRRSTDRAPAPRQEQADYVAEQQPAPVAPIPVPAEDRLLERQIAALGERIDGLVKHVIATPAEQPRPEPGPVSRLRADVARFDAAQGRSEAQGDQLIEALRALDAKVGRLAVPQDNGFSAVAGQLHSLSDRLDAVADKVAGLRSTGPRDLRSHKAVDSAFVELKRMIQQSAAPSDDRGVIAALQALERRLETLDRQQPALVQTFDRVQAIERKLDTIQRTPPELAARLDQLDRLEALEHKLDAMQGAPGEIAARLDDIRAALNGRPQDASHAAGVEAALGALAARVERLHQDKGEQEALRRLHAEVQAISQKIDSATTTNIGEPDTLALDRIRAIESKLDTLQAAPVDLARRLDHIQQLVQAPAPAANMPQGIENLLHNLALRMESIQSSPADDGTLDRLHNDIRQISEKLEMGTGAHHMQGIADVGGLERSISELFGQMQQLRGEIGSAAEQAARRAADQVITQGQSVRENPGDEMVRRQLSDIHTAQQEAERRSNETLGAVHETLTRVVDRLVDLEQDIKHRPAPAAPVAPPALATQPLPPLGAQRPSSVSLPDVQPMSVAALRSQRLGVNEPVAAPETTGKPGIGHMLAAARGAVSGLGRKDKAEAEAPALDAKAPLRPTMDSAPDLSLDLPLEPGSGRPRPGQRDVITESEAKANFLAAARRAAQAAAEQSAEALAQKQVRREELQEGHQPQEPLEEADHPARPRRARGRRRRLGAGDAGPAEDRGAAGKAVEPRSAAQPPRPVGARARRQVRADRLGRAGPGRGSDHAACRSFKLQCGLPAAPDHPARHDGAGQAG